MTYRVLVVDDDPASRESLAAVLSLDVHVETASSGEQALRRLGTELFHVVCSDFHMPGMNGIELLKRVAELPRSTGCLLFTGADEYHQDTRDHQFYVLLKPFGPERLLRLVLQMARIVEMKRSVTALSSSPLPDSAPPSSSRSDARATTPSERHPAPPASSKGGSSSERIWDSRARKGRDS